MSWSGRQYAPNGAEQTASWWEARGREEDLFAPGDQDGLFTTDLVAFLGAQRDWLSANLPKRGTVIEVTEYDQPKLSPQRR